MKRQLEFLDSHDIRRRRSGKLPSDVSGNAMRSQCVSVKLYLNISITTRSRANKSECVEIGTEGMREN